MYSIYRELHPSTGVEHCLKCHFFNLNRKSLAVAAATMLKVYDLCCGQETRNGTDCNEKVSSKLVQVGQYSLYGCVQSMAKVRLLHSKRETLLLSFNDAKLSAVEYDPETNDLKTLSLHCFENDDLRGGVLYSPSLPVVRVDPEGRCAAMLLYGAHLAILPFKHADMVLEEHEPDTPLIASEHHDVQASYTIALRDLSERVSSVKDIQFLHGYNNPTLFILYEPTPTWAGRISLRKDTCNIAAISLNTSEKTSPVIWHAHSLPYDCAYALPVPAPVGGMLLMGANAILYLNQSSPTVGMSLNSVSDVSTNFPLRNPAGNVAITMDCSHAVFITPEQLLVSLKGGEIYLLTLVPDGMRGIRNILFEKAAAAVLTSCICTLGSQYIFLGSRLGNSLLLKYTPKSSHSTEELESPATKKIKSDSIPGDDPDELEVYGTDTTTGPMLTSYKFEVCDSVLNIGPVADITLGTPDFISEEFADKGGPDLELVTCSGHGKSGALCILQRGVRPQVVTTFELPGCNDMWTVLSNTKPAQKKDTASEMEVGESGEGGDGGRGGGEGGGEGGGGGSGEQETREEGEGGEHAYLLLSRSDSTMVLQTGQEIAELDSSGFATQTPTVYAGNLGRGDYIIQVTATDVRLLRDVCQICRIPLDMGGGVRACSLCDPYAVVLLVDGSVVLVQLVESGRDRREDEEGEEGGDKTAELLLTWPDIKGSKVTLISSYTDKGGLFMTEVEDGANEGDVPGTIAPTSMEQQRGGAGRSAAEEEDELLYGDIDELIGRETKPKPARQQPSVEAVERGERKKGRREVVATHWCVLCREDGSMELYSVPEFKLVFLIRNFSSAPTTLKDSGTLHVPQQQSPHPTASSSKTKSKSADRLVGVGEVLLLGVESHIGGSTHPYLLALVDNELVVYRAFKYNQTQNPGHLQLRFGKVLHKAILHDRRKHKLDKQLSRQGLGPDEGSAKFVPRLRVFTNLASYTGVFVCGPYPHWIFLSGRGGMYVHPMYIDGPVTSFAPFHNVNCPHGFLYFNSEGELRISVLPVHLSYDTHWPVRKVPIRCTPHYISYHAKSKVHALVTSEQRVMTEVLQQEDDGSTTTVSLERDPLFVAPVVDHFRLQLFSPASWEVVPNTEYALEQGEHVTVMKVMLLRSQETMSGRKEYIVMGTTMVCSEETSSIGKIHIFDVLDVIPEPGKPLTKNKIKCLYNQEQKGIVSALEAVDGLILSCMGQKIFMWNFKDNKDLVGVAFIDTDIYSHRAVSLKNFIVVGDIHHSIQLLKYKENRRTLSLVSQDPNPVDVYTSEYMVDGNQMGIVVSDSDQNLIVYQYQPEVPESSGGRYLIRQGDINVGSHVNAMFRLRCRSSAPLGSPHEMQVLMQDRRHTTYFATLDGSLGYLLPLPETTFRRLKMLQIKLVQGLPHNAGLNPKAFRTFHTRHQYLYSPQHKVLDGELLWRYIQLSGKEKADFAKQIGTSVGQILEDLKEVDKVSAHF